MCEQGEAENSESPREKSPRFARKSMRSSSCDSKHADQGPRLQYQSKRKASTFSLRSLTKSLSKRPRLGFRKWAHSVLNEGSRRLSLAKARWRNRQDREERSFNVRRVHRCQNQHAEPLKDRDGKTADVFASERCLEKAEEWWKDGTERYHAHKWRVLTGERAA